MADNLQGFLLQGFLAAATQKAATDLADAFERLPEDKRGWSMAGDARPALDLIAECVLLNGYTGALIQTRQWSDSAYKNYAQEKAEVVALNWDTLRARLEESTRQLAEVITAVPGDAMGIEVETPGGTQPLTQLSARQYWNMTYHLGQINYIASMLK